MTSWQMGALAASDRYNPEEGARQAELLDAQQPYRGVRLDPGIRRAPGDTAALPAAQTFGDVVGGLVIPQDPVDYAAMFALGPAGKLASKGVRAGALALGGVLGMSDEAAARRKVMGELAAQSRYGAGR